MRSPKYLDVELLQEVADFYEIDYPVDEVVVEKGVGGKRAGASVGPSAARATVAVESQREVQRTFTVPSNPVRALNTVLDHLEAESGALSASNAGFKRGDLVRVTGQLAVAPVSEIGSLIQQFGPQLATAAAPQQIEVATQILGLDGGNRFKRLLRCAGVRTNFYVVIEDEFLFRSNVFEDLLEDLELLVFVDKVIPAGGEIPVEDWILPRAVGAARRSITPEVLNKMVESLRPVLGDSVADYKMPGPAALVRAVAIY